MAPVRSADAPTPNLANNRVTLTRSRCALAAGQAGVVIGRSIFAAASLTLCVRGIRGVVPTQVLCVLFKKSIRGLLQDGRQLRQ